MATDVAEGVQGSFDDVPDAPLRTVLAVPLRLPPLPTPPAAPPVPSQPAARPGRSRHRRRRPSHLMADGPLATVRVGLSAAGTVFLAVALLLLGVQAFLH